jgi:hypothetical protein
LRCKIAARLPAEGKVPMLRIPTFLSFALIARSLCAQLAPGFDANEARDLMALCVTHTLQELYGSDTAIIPAGYERLYASEPVGLDNKIQVFRKGTLGVIEIRGSTADPLSWMENMHASMIPAKGTIRIGERNFKYVFADEKAASVHAGYALGIAFIADDAVKQIAALNEQGVHDFLITGHSQGGALAHLLRAYLSHLSGHRLSHENRFKTYAFANPMLGNRAFATEYAHDFADPGMSFSIINPQDPVPGMPLNYKDGKLITMDRIVGSIIGTEELDVKGTARSAAIRLFRGSIAGVTHYASSSIERRIANTVGEVRMPPYRDEINYEPMSARIDLDAFPYPRMLKDPSAAHGTGANDAELYREEPSFYQHKPYNYYVAVLRKYFPAEHHALVVKVLPENL